MQRSVNLPQSPAGSCATSIVQSALSSQSFTLQQEENLRHILAESYPFSTDTIDAVSTLLMAITNNQVIPTPSRVCNLYPDARSLKAIA